MSPVLFLLFLPLSAQALPHSDLISCAEGSAVAPPLLQPGLPHCAPAPQQSQPVAPDA